MKKLIIWNLVILTYLGLCLIPGEWFWFDPSEPSFEDSIVGEDPPLRFNREIKRVTSIQYAVLLRKDQQDEPACDARGGPFPYLPERSGAAAGWTLSTWAPSDLRCHHLPVGSYYGVVTWTIVNPYRDLLPPWLQPILGGLTAIIPPKEVRRNIPVFSIIEK